MNNNQNFNNDMNSSNNQNVNNGGNNPKANNLFGRDAYYNPGQNAYYQSIDPKSLMFEEKSTRKKVSSFIHKFFMFVLMVILLAVFGYLVINSAEFSEKYLTHARKSSIKDDAISAINAVRYDITLHAYSANQCYSLNRINQTVEKKFVNSPFKVKYSNNSYVYARINNSGNFVYYICLVDEEGNGINYEAETNLKKAEVLTGDAKCILPASCK